MAKDGYMQLSKDDLLSVCSVGPKQLFNLSRILLFYIFVDIPCYEMEKFWTSEGQLLIIKQMMQVSE